MSDLIIIGYPDETTAENVWAELVKLQHDYLVDLEDAAIIRRDQKGKLHVTTPVHHQAAWGGLSGLFWGTLIGLLFLFPLAPLTGVAGGIMGAALGAAGDLGIKDDFKQRVQDLIQPGTSALLVIVRKATPDKFLEALRPYGGTVLKTSLPRDAEQELMKARHGTDQGSSVLVYTSQPAPTGAAPITCSAKVCRRRIMPSSGSSTRLVRSTGPCSRSGRVDSSRTAGPRASSASTTGTRRELKFSTTRNRWSSWRSKQKTSGAAPTRRCAPDCSVGSRERRWISRRTNPSVDPGSCCCDSTQRNPASATTGSQGSAVVKPAPGPA